MEGSVTFTMAFAAGVLSFLSPCVLPIVPGYLAFITGMSRDELEQTASRRQVLIAAAFFVSGFSLVFLAMGASASLLGQLVLKYREWIARIGGVLIIIFGLHMLGFLRTGVLMRERRVTRWKLQVPFSMPAPAGGSTCQCFECVQLRRQLYSACISG